MMHAPSYDVDFYSDAFIADPLPHYAAMRAMGSVVWLPRHGNYAVVSFAALREAMRAVDAFRSGDGVAGDAAGCAFLRGNTLASDGATHDALRAAMSGPLLPGALEAHRPRIEEVAVELVDKLCGRAGFDGMADVARHLPLTVVTELVGLPEDGRENMLDWAAASFDILGVQNERGRLGIERIKEMRHWIGTRATRGRLRPGSWTARVLDLADEGRIAPDMAPLLIRDYINPSLDTTISATGELLLQLARCPDQWDMIRDDPDLIPRAVDEAVRLSTPIRSFSRTLAHDYLLAGVPLPAGARAMMVFASANRDAAHFDRPDAFLVQRAERDHVGFGHGIHMCVGMHLARLEMSALLRAMVPRVARFHVGEPRAAMNNSIRSYAELPMWIEVDTAPARRKIHPIGPSSGASLRAVVVERKILAETIVGLRLAPAPGTRFAPYDPGAHIDVEVEPGLIRQYSLCGPADEGDYFIAVHREAQSRGGSAAVHDRLAEGTALTISRPRNLFPIDTSAAHHILIAGGIGITPIIAMAWQLHATGASFRLIYRARGRQRAAFADMLEAAPFADRVRLSFDGQARDKDVPELHGCPAGRAIYCCGPAGLIANVTNLAAELGYRPDQIHSERFAAAKISPGAAFELRADRSNVTVQVGEEETMLAALARVGITAPSSCLSGICGSCMVDLLSGDADHRDQVQTSEEKSSNRRVALCCSRARTATLVIDA